ncbi:MAG: YicC family protein, partial [Lachnospiraceae bacterium]|nr:YicC family protein [Lachnospiraceae bacterium]
KIFEEVRNSFSIEDDMRLSSLVRMPEVITLDSSNDSDEELEQLMEEALKQALTGLVSAREKEGEHLKDDLLGKLDYMLTLVEKIEKRSPAVVEEYRKKLTDKVKELLEENSVDENRILTEVVVFADKICVDEETVRLRAHIDNMKKLLIEGGGVGRKLDFVAQEMNREANTTLSKCSDLETSEIAIDLKTEIEKVREQVQNIE